MISTVVDDRYFSKGCRHPGRRQGFQLGRLLRVLTLWARGLLVADRRGRRNDKQPAARENGLHAVSDYARFLAAHPDMPAAHRDRFLGAIIRCSEDLRDRDR